MSRLKVLVLGRRGQLACSLAERAPSHPHLEVEFTSRPEFDLEDEEKIARVIGAHSPDVVLNAAAYTAVDRAETEMDAAHRLNAVAPALIAREARRVGARMVHLSTDYVFDGRSRSFYSEGAAVAPINVYGRTKLVGEEGVRAECPDDHMIVRTSWVYSPFGANFVKTMLHLARTRETLSVVGDQVGTPTSALDLADGLLTAIGTWRQDPRLGLGETYHLAGTGETSWAGLAARTMEISGELGGPAARIASITTAEYSTAAARPGCSVLDSSKFGATFGYASPPWQASLAGVVKRILGSPQAG